jgi:hypothetical protein
MAFVSLDSSVWEESRVFIVIVHHLAPRTDQVQKLIQWMSDFCNTKTSNKNQGALVFDLGELRR